jgi:hypothetical protein
MLKIERMTEECSKKKRAVETEIMDTTSLQVLTTERWSELKENVIGISRWNWIKLRATFDDHTQIDKN